MLLQILNLISFSVTIYLWRNMITIHQFYTFNDTMIKKLSHCMDIINKLLAKHANNIIILDDNQNLLHKQLIELNIIVGHIVSHAPVALLENSQPAVVLPSKCG